jgi:uncharacterized protein YkwD
MKLRDRTRALLSVAAIAMVVAQPAAAAGLPSTPPIADGFTRHLAERINDYRQRHGLAPLALVDDLSALAAEHSQDMASQRQLSHAGFRARMSRTQSKLCVENVAHNFPTPETLLDGWRNSPAHHRNLLEPKVSTMGLAATARYVTFFACR